MKIAIIGAGAVGSACLTAVVMRRFAREVVVLDRDPKKARGLVTDVQYGEALSAATEVRRRLRRPRWHVAGDGHRRVNEKTGGATDRNDPAGRLRLLETNVEV